MAQLRSVSQTSHSTAEGEGFGVYAWHGPAPPAWTENTVPGASLPGRKPSEQTVAELKRWLVCGKAQTTGKKADLVAR
jgi:hypothetical protein